MRINPKFIGLAGCVVAGLAFWAVILYQFGAAGVLAVAACMTATVVGVAVVESAKH